MEFRDSFGELNSFNLDALNEGIFLKSLEEGRDKTVVLVSHRKSTLQTINVRNREVVK